MPEETITEQLLNCSSALVTLLDDVGGEEVENDTLLRGTLV